MREEIFWENLLKILNRGSYTMNGDEIKVFAHIHDQIEKKYKALKEPKPLQATPVADPIKDTIKQPKKEKKSKV